MSMSAVMANLQESAFTIPQAKVESNKSTKHYFLLFHPFGQLDLSITVGVEAHQK